MSMMERAWRWCRRRPAAAALATALVLTLLVSFATVVLFWQRAEGHLRLSTEMAGELVDLAVGGNDGYPRAMTFECMIPVLEKQRKRLLTLTQSHPNDLPIVRSLALVEISLARNLAQASRHEAARIVLLEALGRVESLLQRNPSERDLHERGIVCCENLAQLSEGLGHSEASVAFLKRAVELRDGAIRRVPPNTKDIAALLDERRKLAWMRYSRGDHEQAASLIGENQRLLENPPAACESPALNAERLVCHIDFCEIRSDVRSVSVSGAGARPSSPSSVLPRLASPRDAFQSVEDWARLAAEALHCDDPNPRIAGHREAADALYVTERLFMMIARLRRIHDLVGAKRIAERMLALAKRVVDAHPGEPAAHRALSFAYAQIYKNAYESDNDSEIEPNMKLAPMPRSKPCRWNRPARSRDIKWTISNGGWRPWTKGNKRSDPKRFQRASMIQGLLAGACGKAPGKHKLRPPDFGVATVPVRRFAGRNRPGPSPTKVDALPPRSA